jgi:hypothetical protein
MFPTTSGMVAEFHRTLWSMALLDKQTVADPAEIDAIRFLLSALETSK